MYLFFTDDEHGFELVSVPKPQPKTQVSQLIKLCEVAIKGFLWRISGFVTNISANTFYQCATNDQF